MRLRMIPCLFLVAAVSALASGAETPAAGRVLIVCDERVQMDALAKFLRETGRLEVEIVDQETFPASTAGRQAIIDFVHKPFADRVEKALIDYCEAGGRLVSLHHSISSSKRQNQLWLPFCGMTLPTGPPEKGGWYVVGGTTVTLVNLQPHNYVTAHGVSYAKTTRYTSSDNPKNIRQLPVIEFARSEVFLGQQINDLKDKAVLFGLQCVDPKTNRTIMIDRGGWSQRKGKGWHFYFQVGHATGDFLNRPYCQVLLNAITWVPPKE